jgi:hypothetical protein
MKVLLRKTGTSLYLAAAGNWGAKADAQQFSGLHEAGREAHQHEDVDVILSYDNPPCELALNPAFCATPPALPHTPFNGTRRLRPGT